MVWGWLPVQGPGARASGHLEAIPERPSKIDLWTMSCPRRLWLARPPLGPVPNRPTSPPGYRLGARRRGQPSGRPRGSPTAIGPAGWVHLGAERRAIFGNIAVHLDFCSRLRAPKESCHRSRKVVPSDRSIVLFRRRPLFTAATSSS